MLRRAHTLAACTILAFVFAACDSGTSPTQVEGPDTAAELARGPDGRIGGEEFEVCKYGSAGTFSIDTSTEDFQDEPTIFVTDPFTLEAGECVVVAAESGTGATIIVSEISAESGFQFDSVVVTVGKGNDPNDPDGVGSTDTQKSTDPTVSEFIGGSASVEGFTGVLAEYYNSAEPTNGGGEGCTPGYWKQEHHFDSYPTGVDPHDGIEAHLGELAGDVQLRKPENGSIEDLSLLEALQLRGGGVNALLRHAVAAWLNAGTVAYPLTQSEVVDALNAALTSGDYETTKDELGADNELGCPLN